MKKYFLLFILVASLKLSAQENYIFDTSKITSNTKLIGRYPQYDKSQTYKDLNFIIENPIEIKRTITTLTLGKEGENVIEEPGFTISIVKDKDEIKAWSVNPAFNSIMYNGHTYGFDVNKIRELAIKYPFEYRFDKLPFKNKLDYETYLNIQKQDSTFLFDYSPQFKYEGSFEVQFPRNEQFTSPKAISDYLTPIVERIAAENDYRITYILSKKNRSDQTQFTMTIAGTKKLFEELQLDQLKKENWKDTVEQGWFFYKSK